MSLSTVEATATQVPAEDPAVKGIEGRTPLQLVVARLRTDRVAIVSVVVIVLIIAARDRGPADRRVSPDTVRRRQRRHRHRCQRPAAASRQRGVPARDRQPRPRHPRAHRIRGARLAARRRARHSNRDDRRRGRRALRGLLRRLARQHPRPDHGHRALVPLRPLRHRPGLGLRLQPAADDSRHRVLLVRGHRQNRARAGAVATREGIR